MTKAPPSAGHQALCREYAAKLIEPLRAVAREHGYALGVHDSLARDIDLIAVPWAEPLSPARTLAEAIQEKTREIVGFANHFDADRADNPPYFHEGSPEHKPHGRLCWTFYLGPELFEGPYIDLSVMLPSSAQDIFDRVVAETRQRKAAAGAAP